jgi:uncharacterized YccA/Bax inhibitor family protein
MDHAASICGFNAFTRQTSSRVPGRLPGFVHVVILSFGKPAQQVEIILLQAFFEGIYCRARIEILFILSSGK